MKKKEKKKRRFLKYLLLLLLVLVVVIVGGFGFLFRQELKITGTIEKINEEKPAYSMEVDGDYYFEEFLQEGGASSDQEVSAFLTKKISKGFYSVSMENSGTACSTLSASDASGAHLWGRNYDWTDSVPILVKHTPENGYASISTCDFQHVTGNPEVLPENFITKLLAVAALYVPMDGINEAGLCVADLEVNEGGMIDPDTDKPDLTVTTAIRLLLNKAATVEEAIDLLQEYDIHASAGISHHLSISDASGASVAVEFINGEPVVAKTNCVTNFNLANGDTSAGGESAQKRYESLCSLYEESKGTLTLEQVQEALAQVAQPDGEWKTQWSIAYDQNTQTAIYTFESDYEHPYTISIPK